MKRRTLNEIKTICPSTEGGRIEAKACLQYDSTNFYPTSDWESNIQGAVLLYKNHFRSSEEGQDIFALKSPGGYWTIWRGNWNDGIFG